MAISRKKRNLNRMVGGSFMRRTAAFVTVVAALLSLTACSWFKSDDAKKTDAQAVAADPYVPVESVSTIEIGRTRNGVAITAFGIAPALGFGGAELRPRRDGAPGSDGILDFDFVARAPDAGFNLGEGAIEARAIRADVLLTPGQLQGALGIRIHAASGGLQMMF
jgi:hypothetical protein